MAAFDWTGLDGAARAGAGRVDAADAGAAAALLRSSGWFVTGLSPARDATPRGAPAPASPWTLPVRGRRIAHLFRRLALMTRTGLTVLQSLELAGAQSGSRRVRAACDRAAAAVRSGSPLSRALRAEPQVFPEVCTQLVEAAESTGELDLAFERAADDVDRRLDVRAAILSSLLYPSIVLLAAAGVVTYLVVAVLPKFVQFMAGRRIPMPPAALLLIDLRAFLADNALLLAAIGATLAVAAVRVRRSTAGRLATDAWLLRMPIVGGVLTLAGAARLSEGLSLLLRSGVGVLEALRVCARTLGNRALAGDVDTAAARVLAGAPLSEALRGPRLPPLVVEVTAVGERTGELEAVLRELGVHYERELRARLARIAALVEPVMVLLVGAVVGYVYYAFFQVVLQTLG